MTESTDNLETLQAACRICLQTRESNGMIPIFKAKQGNELTFGEQIEKCAGIQLNHNKNLSSKICYNCLNFLGIAYKFHLMCRNSQAYLDKFVLKPNDLKQTEAKKIKENAYQEEHLDAKFRKPHGSSGDTLVNATTSRQKANKSNNSKSKVNYPSPLTYANELSEEYFNECWLDGEHIIDENKADQNTAGVDGRKGTNEKDEFKTKNKLNVTSKTLGITSDGGAIIEEKAKSPELKRPIKEKKKHICDICGNIYDRRYSLLAHMRRHRGEKPYDCELCGQAFHCNFELSRHIRKHTGHRPHVCEYCKRAFGDRSTLMKHERTHRNERPYSCTTCGKCFTYSSVLKAHQLIHTGEKPYNCQLCGKRFSRSHHLRAHLETLLHQNDPESKELLKKIKRVEENNRFGTEIFPAA